MASLIKWTRSDSMNLRWAVSKFNQAVEKVSSTGIIAPEEVDFKTLRRNISTRQELNRTLEALRKFTNPAQQKSVKLDSGLEVTKWEKAELNKAKRRAGRRLTGELVGLEATSSLGTGNTRINEIRDTLSMFEKIGKEGETKGSFFRRRHVLFSQARLDYDMFKAKVFQENFITAYKKMKRKEVVKLAQSFKNPMDFWEFVKDSGLVDIEMRYDVEEGTLKLALSKNESYEFELRMLNDKLENNK